MEVLPPLGVMWIKTLNKEMTCHREEIEQKKLIKGICLECAWDHANLILQIFMASMVWFLCQ